jgi:hypothetical protein
MAAATLLAADFYATHVREPAGGPPELGGLFGVCAAVYLLVAAPLPAGALLGPLLRRRRERTGRPH